MAEKKMYVQAGKAVTSKRGLLTEGMEVSEADFVGKGSFDAHVKKGRIGAKEVKADTEEKQPEVKSGDEPKAAPGGAKK